MRRSRLYSGRMTLHVRTIRGLATGTLTSTAPNEAVDGSPVGACPTEALPVKAVSMPFWLRPCADIFAKRAGPRVHSVIHRPHYRLGRLPRGQLSAGSTRGHGMQPRPYVAAVGAGCGTCSGMLNLLDGARLAVAASCCTVGIGAAWAGSRNSGRVASSKRIRPVQVRVLLAKIERRVVHGCLIPVRPRCLHGLPNFCTIRWNKSEIWRRKGASSR
jgi:hypothetical protein